MNTNYNQDTYLAQIARGNVAGAELFGAHGKMTTSGSVTNKIIWPNGDWAFPGGSGVQLSLVSDDDEDDKDAGTGIRSVRILYLDTDKNPQTEDVLLEGQTPVTTEATDIYFIQCMHGITFGSNNAAVGEITGYVGAQTYVQINADGTRCGSSMRMVPNGKRLFIASAIASSASGTSASTTNVDLISTFFNGTDYSSVPAFFPYGTLGYQDNSFGINFALPFPFPAGAIFGMRATSDKSATITGDWFGWIENEGA